MAPYRNCLYITLRQVGILNRAIFAQATSSFDLIDAELVAAYGIDRVQAGGTD